MGFNSGFKKLTFIGLCIVRIFQYVSNKMERYAVYFIWKLLYMFRWYHHPSSGAQTTVSTTSGICHTVTVWQIPDAVDAVVCAPDDGWWYHREHVEQFPDKINCVTFHLVWYVLEWSVSLSYFLRFFFLCFVLSLNLYYVFVSNMFYDLRMVSLSYTATLPQLATVSYTMRGQKKN